MIFEGGERVGSQWIIVNENKTAPPMAGLFCLNAINFYLNLIHLALQEIWLDVAA